MVNVVNKCANCGSIDVNHLYDTASGLKCGMCMMSVPKPVSHLRIVPAPHIQVIVDKMFKLFADLNATSDQCFSALEVAIATCEEQFGYAYNPRRRS